MPGPRTLIGTDNHSLLRVPDHSMSTDTDHDEWDEQCTACDTLIREGGENINWIILQRKAEWDYPAAGNVLYDIPSEYAMALVCDECVEADADPEYALKGTDFERVPVEELEELPAMRERIEEVD